jgi:hypothetical protein
MKTNCLELLDVLLAWIGLKLVLFDEKQNTS